MYCTLHSQTSFLAVQTMSMGPNTRNQPKRDRGGLGGRDKPPAHRKQSQPVIRSSEQYQPATGMLKWRLLRSTSASVTSRMKAQGTSTSGLKRVPLIRSTVIVDLPSPQWCLYSCLRVIKKKVPMTSGPVSRRRISRIELMSSYLIYISYVSGIPAAAEVRMTPRRMHLSMLSHRRLHICRAPLLSP